MNKWGPTVDIKVVLNDDDIPDEEKPGKIADILEQRKSLFYTTSIIDDLRRFNGDEYDEQEVNHILYRLYDYADEQRIWLGI